MSREPLVLPYRCARPRLGRSVFLAPGVVVIGDVEIGEEASIWFNTTVRGDVHFVRIGQATNIQDNCVLHVTHDTHPLLVGEQVTVGHSVTLHGCTIGDLALIGIGAVVLDGAVVEPGAMVGAGALVPPGTVVPSGMLAVGVPARVKRPLGPDEMDELQASAKRYVRYARETAQALEVGALDGRP